MSWAAGTEPYTWVAIPKPPFLDADDEKAVLGAALATVTHKVTGKWPLPSQVVAAVDALHDEPYPTDTEETP